MDRSRSRQVSTAVVAGEDVVFLGQVHRIVSVEPYQHPDFPAETWYIGKDALGWSITASESIPCGWCDAPVPVVADRGQVVYCSDDHERMNTYHAEGAA